MKAPISIVNGLVIFSQMAQKTVSSSIKIITLSGVTYCLFKYGYISKASALITNIPTEILNKRNDYETAKKIYLNKDIKLTDFFDKKAFTSIAIEVPEEKGISIKLPKLSSGIKPGIRIIRKKIKNWRNKGVNKVNVINSDLKGHEDTILIKDILKHTEEISDSSEKVSLQDILNEYNKS